MLTPTRRGGWTALIAYLVLNTGCATHAETGALAGGLLGAGVGALAGGKKHAGAGAVIGGATGAVAGGLIGAGQDQVDKKNAERVAAVQAAKDARGMTPAEVINLARSGVPDDTIISQINSTRSVFQLTSQDLIDLQNNGVSQRVVQTMQATASRPLVVQERPVVVRERAVIVEERPAVYVVPAPPPPPPPGFSVGVRVR